MTTTTYPLHKITEALDILQEHGVLEDNTADHALGCWLEENDLTCDDLNSTQPERANDSDPMVVDLKSTLFQYFTKSHFEENENISISDAEWSRFVDGCNDAFADACGEIATEVWESNNHNYTYTQN